MEIKVDKCPEENRLLENLLRFVLEMIDHSIEGKVT